MSPFLLLLITILSTSVDQNCNYGGEFDQGKNACECRSGFSGATCETFSCVSNKNCLNGGLCYRETGFTGSYCVCPLGYSGPDCGVDSCHPAKGKYGRLAYCNDGGDCFKNAPTKDRKYYLSQCKCRDGFSGDFCESYDCNSGGSDICPKDIPDGSGGLTSTTCQELDGSKSCATCPLHRGGLDCEILLCGAVENGNEVTFCNHNGECVQKDGLSVCKCDPMYSGDTCSMGACIPDSDKCQPHGKCVTGSDGGTQCSCFSGYTGDVCDKCADPLVPHAYYSLAKSGANYTVNDEIEVCAMAECIIDGVICNNAGTCIMDTTTGTWGCQCISGFVKDPRTRTCIPTDKSCHSSDNVCGGAGLCEFIVDIGTETAAWRCACRDGYQLDSTTNMCLPPSCFEKNSDTVACNGNGVCAYGGTCSCNDGYIGQLCNVCDDGYKRGEGDELLSNLCLKTYCGVADRCNNLGICELSLDQRAYICKCTDGFFNDPNTKACIQCQTPHCIVCGRAGFCKECISGYRTTIDGVCEKCNSACVSCTGPGSKDCLVCAPGTVRTDTSGTTSGCGPECSEGGDCNFCGAVIGGSKYCSRCSDSSSYPLDGVCTSFTNSRATNACETIGNGVCTSCNKKYFLHQGGCYSIGRVPGSEICVTIDGNGSCEQCNYGFYPTSTKECAPCGNNCAQCTSSTNCQNCTHGFFLQGGSCVGCHESCVRCSGPGADKCIVCKTGYFGQFLANGGTSGSCRSCSDTKSIDGLAGQKGCSMCRIDLTGESPAFLCLDPVGKGLSGGAIAAIVIVVLVVVGGIAGFCIYWFLFRNNTKTGGKKLRSRTADDTDYVSLINADKAGNFI
ncbi:High cysteine membrane protein [Giardia muris]|uniref:High cysteine membrane protein n=1 Tax=Giardia muris TaxID=5742 RepID=A0A4Z1SMM3_GIAMU|nr:High cysteine membrane protein [Giardia muris]|eukprot:TNJ26942.1 High cysteine membrane protein [Giardia muris]